MAQLWTDIKTHAIPWKTVERFTRQWIIVNGLCIVVSLFLAVILPFVGIIAGIYISYLLIRRMMDKQVSTGWGMVAYLLGLITAEFIKSLFLGKPDGLPYRGLIMSLMEGTATALWIILLQGRRIHQETSRRMLLIVSYILAYSGGQVLLILAYSTPVIDFNLATGFILIFIWFNLMTGFGLALIQKEIPYTQLPFSRLPDNILGKTVRVLRPIVLYALLLGATYYLRFSAVNLTLNLFDPPYRPPLTGMGQSVPIPAEAITAQNARKVVPLAQWNRYNMDPYHYDLIRNVQFSADSRSLWTCSIIDSQIRIWSLESSTFTNAPMKCDFIDLNSAHQLLAVQYQDSIHLYNTADWNELWTDQESAFDIHISPDGTHIAAADHQEKFLLREISNPNLKAELPKACSVAFNTDSTLMAAGDCDGVVRVWRTADLTLLHTLDTHDDKEDTIDSVAFNPQHTVIAASSGNGKIYLWSLETGQLLRVIDGNPEWIGHIEFSPDGSVLALHARSLDLKMWNSATGRPLMEYNNRALDFHTFNFSPDGTLIALVGQESDTILILGIPKRD